MDLHEIVSKLKDLAHELGRTPTLREFTHSGISKRQIHKHTFSNIVALAGLEPNKHAQNTDPVKVELRPPRILVFDLEVSTKVVHTYQFYNVNISPSQIIRDFYILSYSAKFIDEDEVYYLDCRPTEEERKDLIKKLKSLVKKVSLSGDLSIMKEINDLIRNHIATMDLKVIKELSELISDCDYIVGHNMQRFDLPTLNARLIQNDLAPLKPVPIIDTLKMARKSFKFSSNKLGELAKYLKCEVQKDDHSKFSGITLFTEAMEGNLEAFESMEHYCKMDSIVTEAVFKKLARFDSTVNFQSNIQELICSCGGKEFFKNGFKYARAGAFQIWRCVSCSKCHVDKTNSIDKETRKTFFK